MVDSQFRWFRKKFNKMQKNFIQKNIIKFEYTCVCIQNILLRSCHSVTYATQASPHFNISTLVLPSLNYECQILSKKINVLKAREVILFKNVFFYKRSTLEQLKLFNYETLGKSNKNLQYL